MVFRNVETDLRVFRFGATAASLELRRFSAGDVAGERKQIVLLENPAGCQPNFRNLKARDLRSRAILPAPVQLLAFSGL